MDKTALGDRMKGYEQAYSSRAMPLLPVLARIDGKNFSKWTKGLDRPFDEVLGTVMERVMHGLVVETGALAGYTQSDEISLLWYSDDPKSEIFHGGKLQKLTSVTASLATSWFNKQASILFDGDRADRPANFDCRVWQVPTREEAANYFIWRQRDAVKNSIQMAARTVISHKEAHGKNGSQLQELMFQRGINWNNYPARFKRGVFGRHATTSKPFSAEELEKLPPMHHARTNPGMVVERRSFQTCFTELASIGNRLDFLFEGASPTTRGSTGCDQ